MTIFRCDAVDRLSLRPRTISILQAAGIRTVGDLTDKTMAELTSLPRFGSSAALDCERALEQFGLWLKPERTDGASLWTEQLRKVQRDRDTGKLVRETATELGLSTARISQLRRRVEVIERKERLPDVWLIRWQTQFKSGPE